MERHIRAFGLELLFGYMGFLGVGWLYGRRWLIGVPLLLVWMPFLLAAVWAVANAGQIVSLPIASICAALVLFPIYLAVPMASAWGVRRQLAPKETVTSTPRPAPENDPGQP